MRRESLIKFFLVIAVALIASAYVAFSQQFSFTKDTLNLGQINPDLIRAYTNVKIGDAWQKVDDTVSAFPRPIKIGIIDSGMDSQHPEFQNVNLGNTPANAKFDHDPTGHGTQVAGIIGANNISFPDPTKYVPPQMNGIMSGVKNLNYSIEHRYHGGLNLFSVLFDITTLAPAINGVDVINISLDFSYPNCNKFNTYILEKIFNVVLGSRPNNLFVISAGKIMPDIADVECFIPAALGNDLSNVITAGGTNLDDTRFSLSPSGAAVNISAPAENVYAPVPKNNYGFFLGTSAAAPMVTGVAGLVKAIKPDLTPAQIKQILIETADPIQTGEPTKRIGTGCYSNPNDPTNTGCRLNAYKAVCHPLVLNCAPPPPPTAAPWPMFQHDPQHTGYIPGVTATPPFTPKWFYQANGSIEGSAVIAGNTVYFGSADKNIYALDKNSGELKWQYSTGGPIYTTPAVWNNLIFVHNANEGPDHGAYLYALDLNTGELKWKFKTGTYQGDDVNHSSPAIANDTIYVGSPLNKLYAIEAASGNLKWQADIPGSRKWVFSSPAVDEGVVLVFAGTFGSCLTCETLYAFDAATGNQKWAAVISTPYVYPIASISDGNVYVRSGGAGWPGTLYALNIGTGREIWSANVGYSTGPACPTIDQNKVYIASFYNIYAFNKNTGAQVWNFNAGPEYAVGSSFLTLAGNFIYAKAINGNVYALDADTGNFIWKSEIAGVGHPEASSPVFDLDGKMFVGIMNGRFYAFGR